MATTWITCDIDAKKEDQVKLTYNVNDGSAKASLVQTWVVGCEPTVPGTVQSNPVDALTVSVSGGKTLPIAGDSLTGDYSAFTVTSVMPKRTGPTTFDVQVQGDWSYQPNQSGKFNVSISVDGQVSTQDAYFDKDNHAVVNTAGCSFSPTLKEEIYDEVFDVSYSTATDQSEAFAGVRGQVNGSSISFAIQGISRTFSARQLKCIGAKQSADLPQQSGTATFKCSVRFGSRTDTWIDQVLDEGYYALDATTGDVYAILDKNKDQLSAPVKLDGHGNPLPDGATPVTLTFKIETEADFTAVFTGLA